jgi:hypothetical protein
MLYYSFTPRYKHKHSWRGNSHAPIFSIMLILEAWFRYLILILQFAEPFEILTIISMSYWSGLLPCSGMLECPKSMIFFSLLKWEVTKFFKIKANLFQIYQHTEISHLLLYQCLCIYLSTSTNFNVDFFALILHSILHTDLLRMYSFSVSLDK